MSAGEWSTAVVLGAAALGFGLGLVREVVLERREDAARRRAVWRDVAERERARAALSELGQRGRRP